MTSHEGAIAEIVDEAMGDAAWATTLGQICAKMNGGFYPPSYLDIFLQKCARVGRFDLNDAYAFGRLHAAVAEGHILTAKIHAGEGPRSDNQVDSNNKILSDLPQPFKAHFVPEVGRGANDDGSLWWAGSIETEKRIATNQPESVTLAPTSVPLEVGYVLASKVIEHLTSSRGVARWPYYSEWIHLLILNTDLIFTMCLPGDEPRNKPHSSVISREPDFKAARVGS